MRAAVERHAALLDKRGSPMSWEGMPPVGQAGEWFWEVMWFVSAPSAQNTARQIARLCGQDSEVSVPWRSLADAVGIPDKAGRTMAYVQSGVETLERYGWLEVETTGKGRGSRTTFKILPGERIVASSRIDLLPFEAQALTLADVL